ncbi:MAG TPA: GDSL-type esterase/lipase family protein [Micromonosporaceae bacterium]
MRGKNGRLVLIGVAAVAILATVLITVGRPGAARASDRWIGTWAAAQHAAGTSGLSKTGFNNQTIRMTVHTSIGGRAVRIRLSNEFGTTPLTVGEVTVGLADRHDHARVPTVHRVTFSGHPTVVVGTGAVMLSDAVNMAIPALGDVTVSLWLPQATGPTTFHTVSRTTSYTGRGDDAENVSGAAFSPISLANPIPGKTDSPWFYLSGIDVLNDSANGAVVVFGDSISDGFTSGLGVNGRWPDLFAKRLHALPADRRAPAVLNASLSGDALGHQTTVVPQLGPDALSRFGGDVLGQTGARTVIMQLGINDILIWNDNAQAIIAEMRQVAIKAHEAGLRIFVCTLSPWKGSTTWTPAGEKTRQLVNQFVRSTTDFDGYVDVDRTLRDPDDQVRLRPGYDSGDHLHPTPLGYQAMADAMPIDKIIA